MVMGRMGSIRCAVALAAGARVRAGGRLAGDAVMAMKPVGEASIHIDRSPALWRPPRGCAAESETMEVMGVILAGKVGVERPVSDRISAGIDATTASASSTSPLAFLLADAQAKNHQIPSASSAARAAVMNKPSASSGNCGRHRAASATRHRELASRGRWHAR